MKKSIPARALLAIIPLYAIVLYVAYLVTDTGMREVYAWKNRKTRPREASRLLWNLTKD